MNQPGDLKTLQAAFELKQKELDLIRTIDYIRDTAPEPTVMLADIVNLLADQLQLDLCLLVLLDRESGGVELKAINERSRQFDQLGQVVTRELAQRAIALDRVALWESRNVLPAEILGKIPPELQLAAVPVIMSSEERLGALLLARASHPFSQDDVQLLQTAEDQIDSAIIQGYAYYELQQRLKELETIYRIDHIRDQNLPFDEMLNIVLQELCQVIKAEMGFAMLYDQAGKRLEMRAATHNDLFQMSPYYTVVDRVANEALQQTELVCRNDLDNGLRSVMCIPLILNDHIIGVLGVVNGWGPRGFSTADRRLLTAIGSQMDTAIFESLEQRRLRQVLGRSVDPRVMERLLANPDVNFLKGERSVLTVLYADLRGSTRLAEHTSPELFVGFINHYLTRMTEIVLAHEGTLDKFIGDEVMALFGAPFPQADHALRAVRVGLAMQAAQGEVMEIWRGRGVEAAPVGIGIATGDLIVGEIGSPQRTQYTAIGQAANLGARICSVAKPGQVLISQATYDLTQDGLEATPIPEMQFKGITSEVTVYEVTRIRE